MTVIPELTTRRLVLRGPEAADYPDFKATFSSYRSRFMGGPLNAYETWMLYAAEIGHWQIRGYGMWMIHDRKTDETLGMAGGLAGLAISPILVNTLAGLADDTTPPIMTTQAMLIAFGFSAIIGCLAGLFPAIKAAKLDPIQALRYD